MVTEGRGWERAERNVPSFPETNVHSTKRKQPAAILTGNHTKMGWRGGQSQHRTAGRKHTGFRDSDQLDALSPASPELWLEFYTGRISEAFNKGPERKSSCLSAAHRVLRPCANCTSQVVFETFSPWHFPSSPLLWKGRQQLWGGVRLQNSDIKCASLALCRIHSWGRPQLGKDNLNCIID